MSTKRYIAIHGTEPDKKPANVLTFTVLHHTRAEAEREYGQTETLGVVEIDIASLTRKQRHGHRNSRHDPSPRRRGRR